MIFIARFEETSIAGAGDTILVRSFGVQYAWLKPMGGE